MLLEVMSVTLRLDKWSKCSIVNGLVISSMSGWYLLRAKDFMHIPHKCASVPFPGTACFILVVFQVALRLIAELEC